LEALEKGKDGVIREAVTVHNIDDVFVVLHSLSYSMGGQALLKVELLHPHVIKSAEHLEEVVSAN
jgi:hypothetical protein